MFGLMKQVFLGLLASIVNASSHAEGISLKNQQCMIQATLINLHPNQYGQGLRYYPFVFNLEMCGKL